MHSDVLETNVQWFVLGEMDNAYTYLNRIIDMRMSTFGDQLNCSLAYAHYAFAIFLYIRILTMVNCRKKKQLENMKKHIYEARQLFRIFYGKGSVRDFELDFMLNEARRVIAQWLKQVTTGESARCAWRNCPWRKFIRCKFLRRQPLLCKRTLMRISVSIFQNRACPWRKFHVAHNADTFFRLKFNPAKSLPWTYGDRLRNGRIRGRGEFFETRPKTVENTS